MCLTSVAAKEATMFKKALVILACGVLISPVAFSQPRPSQNKQTSFFLNDTATTEIYTLSLHDALPIRRSHRLACTSARPSRRAGRPGRSGIPRGSAGDRKSTRLNSSHLVISYAVFCLKKKKKIYVTYQLIKNKIKKNPRQ